MSTMIDMISFTTPEDFSHEYQLRNLHLKAILQKIWKKTT